VVRGRMSEQCLGSYGVGYVNVERENALLEA
jgi:hypothetical protein